LYFNERGPKSAFMGDLSEIAAKRNVRESFMIGGWRQHILSRSKKKCRLASFVPKSLTGPCA
jgi:hypothetical protein